MVRWTAEQRMSAWVTWPAFGRRLAEARAHVRLRQADVARSLGVTPPAYIAYERGVTRPRRERFEQLATVLEIDLDELLALAGYAPRIEG